ncbi:MAG: hypothetical protein H5T69_00255 [Chloroflexi bacterium]|nr:hypothetical protein [Chloroflexota bacterium]
MDRYGEVFVRLRDTLARLGLAESKAIIVARHQARGLVPLLAGEARAISSKALRWEVARRAERALAPMIQKAKQAVPEFFEGWNDFAEAWRGERPLYSDIGAGMLFLAMEVLKHDVSPDVARRVVVALLGGEPTLEPPLLFQERPGAPVRLVFWSVAKTVSAWAPWQFPPLAVTQGLPVPPAELVEPWDSLQELLDCAHLLGHLQWDAAGIIGSLCGRDDVGLAWYPYAVRYHEAAGERLEAFLSEGRLPSIVQEVEASPALEIVGGVTRHILHSEPLAVPVLTGLELRLGDRPVGGRIIVNHPLVSSKEIGQAAQKVRRSLGRTRAHPLSAGDEAFLELVRELGGAPGQRLPKGFWERFQAEWARRYPDNPLSVNHLRVKYHRLVRRIKQP